MRNPAGAADLCHFPTSIIWRTARETEDELAAYQVRCATRVASAPGDLIYEEMHKLFSLLDEVYALRETRHPVDRSLWWYTDSLQQRGQR
jgi:hypothetical protein